MKIEEIRGEQSVVPEIRVEAATPTTNRNLIENHPIAQIIGRKEKGVMTRSIINEELCLISQVEPRSVDEEIKDNYWKEEMKE